MAEIAVVHDGVTSEHRIGFPTAELHYDVLRNTSANEIPRRCAAKVVRGPTE
jgi:hypothetical protein